MKKVVITSEFFGRFSDKGEKILRQAGFEVIPNPYNKALVEEEVRTIVSPADAMICDLEKITRRVIDGAPKLKLIARRGVGVDSVDVDYAKSKGIAVTRTLGVVEKPVAELVMAYILQIYRKTGELNREMKQGIWNKTLGYSVEDKVLGIVGLGNIGRELVRKAKAFDMKTIYTDVMRNKRAEQELGVDYVDMDELLAQSDVISIHMPLTDITENMFNYDLMKKMKRCPVLINTARGPIVNEDDLCKALEENLISFAAIDVFDVEPKTDSPLRKHENVILTPHIATFTKEVFVKMDVLAAQNIVEYFKNS